MYKRQHEIKTFAERDPAQIPWGDVGADIVVESTGVFTSRDGAAAHIEGGAKKVIISAPGKGVDATFVFKVNHEDYDPEAHEVVSNASCTTNCIIPLVKVLQDNFGIESGYMTTVHAYTNDQSLLDAAHKDPRRARSAPNNIVPTSTGAARTAGVIYPDLEGKVDGMAMRVPVADGSITDFVARISGEASADDVNAAFQSAADGELSGILEYSEAPLVSSDIIGTPFAAATIEGAETHTRTATIKINLNKIKGCAASEPIMIVPVTQAVIYGWYDNELGSYTNMLADRTISIAEQMV